MRKKTPIAIITSTPITTPITIPSVDEDWSLPVLLSMLLSEAGVGVHPPQRKGQITVFMLHAAVEKELHSIGSGPLQPVDPVVMFTLKLMASVAAGVRVVLSFVIGGVVVGREDLVRVDATPFALMP
jgi:hypothetical protein